MGLPVYHEPVINNEYLADFYKDLKKYAFPLQIYLLNNRFAQQQQIIWSHKGGIADRSIYEDVIFAKILKDDGLMDERDFRTYTALFSNMSNFMRKPNLIVHLDVTPEESLERIKLRGRECEAGITLDYLRKLYAGYEAFLDDISRYIPVLRVAWHDYADADSMARVIRREYMQMRSLRYVTRDDIALTDISSPSDDCSPQRSTPSKKKLDFMTVAGLDAALI